MASIVGCPSCASNLELPPDVDIAARAACPVCQAEFPVCQAPLQALPKAVLLAGKEKLPTSGGGVDEGGAEEGAEEGIEKRVERDVKGDVERGAAKPQAASSLDEVDALSGEAFESSDRLGELLSSYLKSDSDEASSALASSDDPAPTLPSDADPTQGFTGKPLSSFASASSLLSELEDSLANPRSSDSPDDPSHDAATDDPAIEPVVETAASAGALEDVSPGQTERLDLTVPTDAARPRRRSPAIGIAATLLAVLVGAYAAVWIGGPRADMFHLAAGPKFLLPPSMSEGIQEPAAMARAESSVENANRSGASDVPEADSASSSADGSPTRSRSTDAAAAAQMTASRGPAAEEGGAIADKKSVAGLFSDPHVQTVDNQVREQKNPALRWPASALRQPQFYPIEDLQSLREANELAAAEFVEGDLRERDAVGRKGRAYMKLCALAERLTLADPADHGIDATTQRLVAKEILRQAVASPTNRESLAQIASRWLQYSGRPNQGILLAGRVADINAVGPDVEYAIELQYQGGTASANVLQKDITFRTGTTVGVIGIILDDPSRQLVAYEGGASQVVLPIYAFDPDAPPESADFNTLAPPTLMLSP